MIDERPEPSTTADERSLLTGLLDWHRLTLEIKCAELSDEQLRQHAVPSSNLTLLGLMRHLACAEWWWFQRVMAGESTARPYDSDEFDNLDSVTGESANAILRAQIMDQSHRVTAERSLDDVGTNPVTGEAHSLRWVLNHMIEEYARHNGHADLIREAIDGQVGE
jgi:hypothetical protein